MAIKIPEFTPKHPRALLFKATMPSTATMLMDLRETLLNQIAEHKRTADTSLNSAKVTMTLMSAVQALENQTSQEQQKAESLFEDASPEEQEQLAIDAQRLLTGR